MKRQVWRILALGLFCVFAAAANQLLHNISVYYFKIPLYVDTVFNAAVCFAAGFVPGLITALLPSLAFAVMFGSPVPPFIVCSIAEVCIVCLLKPSYPKEASLRKAQEAAEMRQISLAEAAGIFARLMVLFIVCALAISILGGVIDFIYHDVLSGSREYFNVEDNFKIGLLDSDIPTLVINILSRIPINIVDRFFVIFGGYGVALLYRKISQ